ncbi:EAL domain-containing protein [Limnohabitans sp.]|uniref:EAL domain-containing protein n=1 Tax=Limnohabitans sp. TaxID=1907725 RepID=UPI002FDE7451
MPQKYVKTWIVLPAALAALVIASVLGFYAVRHFLIQEHKALVHTVAQSFVPALLVNDNEQVKSLMQGLQSHRGLETAELISAQGAALAAFARSGESADDRSTVFALASTLDDDNQLHLMAPVTFDSLILANLHIAVNLWPIYLRWLTWLGVLLIVPSVIYVLVKQLRIRVRFEKLTGSGGAHPSDGGVPFDLHASTAQAMADAQISLQYQPIRRMSDGGLFGMEVLACWQPPSGETLFFSPADFAHLSDQTGISLPFDAWLLRAACAKAAAWQRQHGPLVLTIDISEAQFKDPLFAQTVREICDQVQFPYQLLELEVRESIFMSHLADALSALQVFVSKGLRVNVEGFGLMQSSLELLKSQLIHKIKLDGKLTSRMTNDASVAELIQLTITQALACDVVVMSEQIESPQQLVALQRMGCMLGQGTYFEPPLSEASFQMLLAKGQFELPKRQMGQQHLLPL